MKRTRRLNIHILLLFAVLLTAACEKNGNDPYKVLTVRIFSVSGNVTGITPDGERSALKGVEVTISAYSNEDRERTIPIYTDRCVTSDEGKYQFFKIWEDDCSDLFFEFNLKDVSTERETRFKATARNLYMSVLSPFYYPEIKAYEVTGNDFELVPESD